MDTALGETVKETACWWPQPGQSTAAGHMDNKITKQKADSGRPEADKSISDGPGLHLYL